MIPRHALTSILLLLLSQPSLYAAESAEATRQETVQQESVPQTQDNTATPLVQDPALVTGQLENGLRYMIRPTREPAGRACVRLFVNTGSLNETPENSGISHFLEHLVFNGSRHFKRGELIPTMQKLGLGFGGDANAYTSFLQTVYKLDLPNLNEETVDFALTILRDFGDGATLSDDAIDHERGIIVSELKSRDSESLRTTIANIRFLAPGSRIADYMPIGREEVIRHASYSVFRDYYRTHYVPGNMTVILTGDFSSLEAETWIRKHFADMEARAPEPREPFRAITDSAVGELVHPNAEQANVSVSVSVLSPYEEKADTLQQRIAEVPLTLATSMLNRRLARIARKADSPFISAGAYQSDVLKASEVFSLSVTAEPKLWKEALARAEQELRSACEYGFSDAELQELVQDIETSLKQQALSWPTVTAAAMASDLVDSIAENTVPTAPDEDARVFRAALQAVAADPDICRRALAQEYDAARARLAATGQIADDLTPEKLREVYDAAHAQAAPQPEKQEELHFAYGDTDHTGTVAEQTVIEDLDVTTLRLSNNIRLNLKPTDFSKGVISVTAAVDGGSLNMPVLPGLTTMLKSVMNNGGLEAHTHEELQRILSGKRAGVSFGILSNRFLFQGSTNAEDFEFQCKLLVAHILHPGYRKDGEELLRRELPSFYQRLETTPDGAFSQQAPRILYNNDPRFCTPTPEQMSAVNTEQARAVVEPFLKDGAVEVTIVGDFKTEDILPALLRSFGAMPERKADFNPIPEEKRTVSFAPWNKREFLRYKTELDKTIVTQIRPAGNGRDHRRNRRLNLLAAIAREKLFDGLRAAMGQAYSPIVRYNSNEEYDHAAFFTAISHGVKGNRELVDSAMFSIFSGLGEGAISDEDFECAIRPMLTASDKLLRTNTFWSGSLLYTQSIPEKIDQIRDLKQDLQSITADEIRTLAKEVFGAGKTAHFFTMPEGSETDAQENAANGRETEEAPSPTPTAAYTVLISQETAALPEWKQVADALAAKYEAKNLSVAVEVLSHWDKENIAAALRRTQARYAAAVLRPEEITRPLVSDLHRASRMVDDDPWGDCLWGIITGYEAKDALRIARADKPLVIKRFLGTTNVTTEPFEYSYCITDWTGFPVLEQSGYTPARQTTYTPETPEGKAILSQGTQGLFSERLEKAGAQLLVTSSHATPFNLEMPFSMGLIFPHGNRFYQLPRTEFKTFAKSLAQVMQTGSSAGLQTLAEKCTPIEPDGTPRVWLAAGNCLIGNACGSAESMVVTALSAYTCNQFIGYTVPSWYGEAGWGTLSCFFDNTDGTTLAEAFFLNNQFLLDKSTKLDPKILSVEFNDAQISKKLMLDVRDAGLTLTTEQELQQVLGLVHDRDVLAFYGDPAWSATVDSSHSPRPFRIEWKDAKTFVITANSDHKGRCGVFFPTAETGRDATGCNIEGAVLTDDFILFPELDMQKGQSITVNIH